MLLPETATQITAADILAATASLARTQAADPRARDGVGFNNADFPMGLVLANAGAVAPAAALLFCYPDQAAGFGITRESLVPFLPVEITEKGRSAARQILAEGRNALAGKVAFAQVGTDEVLFNGVRLSQTATDSLKKLGAVRTTNGWVVKMNKIDALKGLVGSENFLNLEALDTLAATVEQVTLAVAAPAPKKFAFTVKVTGTAPAQYLNWEYASNNATFGAIKDIVKPMSSGFKSGLGWLVTPNQLVMAAMTLVEAGLEGVDVSALVPFSTSTDTKLLDLRDEIRSGSLKVKIVNNDEKSITLCIRRYDSAFVEACKSVRGRYNGEPTKSWTVALTDLPKVAATLLAYSRFDLSLLDPFILDTISAPAPTKIEGIDTTPTGLKLFPHQVGDIEFLLQDFSLLGTKGGLLANDMGLGKTLSSMYAAHIKCPQGRKLVVVPSVAKENWLREIKRFLGEDQTVQIVSGRTDTISNATWIVINYDIISFYKEALIAAKFSYVIMDEVHQCFPAGTTVLTREGLRPIEAIVEAREEVSVASFNFSTHVVEWKPVVGWVKTPLQNRLLKVTHEHGSFVCTEDHRIWTDRGYKEARTLQGGEKLRVVWGVLQHTAEGEKHSPVLLPRVCSVEHELRPEGEISHLEGREQAEGAEGMRNLRGGLPGITGAGREKVLRELLCSDMEGIAAGERVQVQGVYREGATSVEGADVSRNFRAYEGQEPHARPCYTGTGSGLEAGPDVSRSGRERETDETSDASSTSVGIPVSCGVQHPHCGSSAPLPLTPTFVCGGLGGPHTEAGNRGGWGYAQAEEVEVSGCSENGGLGSSRVVSVEVLERGDSGEPGSCGSEDTFVYCLSVLDNNNFFADRVLVHNCKNLKAQRTQALISYWDAKNKKMIPGIVDSIPNVLPMSGTPMLNRPNELFSILRALGSNMGKSKSKYEERYCDGHFITVDRSGRQVWSNTGSSNSGELASNVAPFFRKLFKSDVLSLPPKIRTSIPVEISKADRKRFSSLFDALENANATDDNDEPTGEILRLIGILKHETAKVKVASTIEQAETIVQAGEKVIVFTCYTDTLDQIAAHFGSKAVVVDGSVTGPKRQAAVDAFQNNPEIQVFVGNVKAAGVAITLTAASHVIFNDRDWTPAMIFQAEDRAYRIGQTKMVNVYHMTAEGTFDEELVAALDGKSSLISGWEQAAIDGSEIKEVAASSVKKALFAYIENRKRVA